MNRANESVPFSLWASVPLLKRLRCMFNADAAFDASRHAVGRSAPAEPFHRNLCILVVDDNPDNLMVTSEMLGSLGIAPLLAADGAQAVACASERRLDLILMDLQMPVLDGLGATRQIRRSELAQARARVPVVAYTSAFGNGLQLEGYGFDGTLEKPCEIPALRECLTRWCPSLERSQ